MLLFLGEAEACCHFFFGGRGMLPFFWRPMHVAVFSVQGGVQVCMRVYVDVYGHVCGLVDEHGHACTHARTHATRASTSCHN